MLDENGQTVLVSLHDVARLLGVGYDSMRQYLVRSRRATLENQNASELHGLIPLPTHSVGVLTTKPAWDYDMIREWAAQRPHRPVELPSSWQELKKLLIKQLKPSQTINSKSKNKGRQVFYLPTPFKKISARDAIRRDAF